MYFYKQLYTDEKTTKKQAKICRRLRMGIGQLKVYVIAVGHGDDLFEIYHAATLKQKGFPREDVVIMGLACEYASAVELATQMFQDLYSKYGLYFKQTFLNQEQDMFRR